VLEIETICAGDSRSRSKELKAFVR
jgi:hypothetical protein